MAVVSMGEGMGQGFSSPGDTWSCLEMLLAVTTGAEVLLAPGGH